MPYIDVICLANSRKRSGRCVAGIRLDGDGWIRPVSMTPEGSLNERHYTLNDGSEARALDLLRIPLSQPSPQTHHPEDYLLKAEPWELLSRALSTDAIALLKASLVQGPELLGNTEDRITYPSDSEEMFPSSLALIQPENLRLVAKTVKSGERRLRVTFTLAGAEYNLAITDIEWETRLKEVALGEYRLQDFGVAESAIPLLTVSLSEPFASETGDEARCYKIVAALLLAPEGWNPPLKPSPPPSAVEETPEPAPPKRGGKKRGVDAVAEPKPEPISETQALRVAVCGAAGRMGREVVRAVFEAEGLQLVAAIDKFGTGQDAGDFAGCGTTGVLLEEDLESALLNGKPDVMVDFTLPDSVLQNLRIAVRLGVSPVVGTTGLSAVDLLEIDNATKERGIGAFVAPNFAIGAVLMMEFAAQAAKYMPDVEIIEMHHEKKLDSPSGTALLTAKKIAEARTQAPAPLPKDTVEKVTGARGANLNDIPIHSVRLQGYVAHQEVIFGGLGQTLTLRHDSLDRRSFMPGVVLAVRKVRTFTGLMIGLEKLL